MGSGSGKTRRVQDSILGINSGTSAPSCSKCKDSKIISTGYHGPPGDDRGHLPCSACQGEAFHACLLRGDFMYGVSITDAFNAIREVKGESPIVLNAPSGVDDSSSSSKPVVDVVESEEEKEKRQEQTDREKRREDILAEMSTPMRTNFLA